MVAYLATLCVLLFASSAWAKKRVVVLDFTGPQGAKAEAAVISAVKKQHTIVSAGQYNKAAKKLKAKKKTPKNVRKVAGEIQVDGIVTGAIKKKGGTLTLTVTVREGATGKVKGTAKITLRGKKIDAQAKDDINSEVLPLIAKLRPIAGGGGGDDSDAGSDEVASDDSGSSGADETPAADDSSSSSGDDESAPGVDDDKKDEVASSDDGSDGESSSVTKSTDDGDGGEPMLAGSKYARHGGFEIDVGVSALGRSLTFNTAGLAETEEPNGYDGQIVPGALIAGQVYPMAFLGDPRGALAGLGVTFAFDRVFVLKSRYDAAEYDTTQQHFGIGLRYRYNFGKTDTGPTVWGGIGYNKLTFAVDSGATVIGLPDVDYTYLDPGIGVRFPVGTPRLAVLAEAKYMIISDSGEMQEATNFGGGSVAGTDLDIGVEFRLMPRLPIRAGFKYVRIAYDFDGTGAQTNRDGEAGQDVGGALDTYTGGYVTAGYIF